MHKAVVSARTPLANGFFQVGLACDLSQKALPGQYILVNEVPYYLLSENLEIIAPNSMSQELTISDIQGEPFSAPDKSKFQVMVFEDDALSAGLFYFRKYRTIFNGIAFIGTKTRFPFLPAPSRILIKGLPSHVIASIPLLDDWQIPNRLASLEEMPGVFHGTVNALAQSFT